MILHNGNMWDVPGIKIVTTNGVINDKDCLVMGAGAALEASKRYRYLTYYAGLAIKESGALCNNTRIWHYGFLLVHIATGHHVGLFQTKYHFKDNSNPDLIYYSTMELARFARAFPNGKYVLNFPGIGLGGLYREDVLPIIEQLPDNVTVCEF